jgi:hypothetical protein
MPTYQTTQYHKSEEQNINPREGPCFIDLAEESTHIILPYRQFLALRVSRRLASTMNFNPFAACYFATVFLE